MNLLGCPCEATYGWLLQDKSRLHSDLFMSTLVIALTRMKFLSIRSTWFEVGTSLYLLVTTKLMRCRVHNLGCCTHGCIQDFKGRLSCLWRFWLHVDMYIISFWTTLQ